MGRLVKLAIAACLVLGGTFAACMVSGRARADRLTRALLEDAATPTAAAARFHPALVAVADPQQLVRLLQLVGTRQGAFRGFRLAGLSLSDETDAAGHRQRVAGVAAFAGGEQALELEFLDGLLAAVNLPGEPPDGPVARVLSRAPESGAGYAPRGRDFWARALDGEAVRAFGMLHPDFQERLGQGAFEAQMAGLASRGRLEEVRFVAAPPDPSHPGKLHLLYQVRLEQGSFPAHVTLQFLGLQSYLVGFQLPSSLAAGMVASP